MQLNVITMSNLVREVLVAISDHYAGGGDPFSGAQAYLRTRLVAQKNAGYTSWVLFCYTFDYMDSPLKQVVTVTEGQDPRYGLSSLFSRYTPGAAWCQGTVGGGPQAPCRGRYCRSSYRVARLMRCGAQSVQAV